MPMSFKENLVVPFIVDTSGMGRMKRAPHRSTMHRCLISTKLTVDRLISEVVMLIMMVVLVTMVMRMMREMMKACSGWERR